MIKSVAQKSHFLIGVFGIIFDQKKKVLLAKRQDFPFWNLPGGRVEKGETPDEALAREVKEEIGAEVKSKKLCGVYFKKGKDEIVFNYLVSIKSFVFRPTNEASEIEYFLINKLPKKLPESHRQRIKDALKFKNKITPKVQIAGSSKELLKR